MLISKIKKKQSLDNEAEISITNPIYFPVFFKARRLTKSKVDRIGSKYI